MTIFSARLRLLFIAPTQVIWSAASKIRCYALRSIHLLDNKLQTVLYSVIQIGQISPLFSVKAQIIEVDIY